MGTGQGPFDNDKKPLEDTPAPEAPEAEIEKSEPVEPAPKSGRGIEELRAALKEARNEAASRRVEKNKLKTELEALQSQFTKLETDKKAREDAELTKQQKWQQLAEKRTT